MRSQITNTIAAAAALLAAAAAAPAPLAAQDFDTRAGLLLDQFARPDVQGASVYYSKYAFWYAQANFERGRDADALAILDAATSHYIADEGQATFRYWGMIDCYLRWRDKYPAALADRTRDTLLAVPYYGGGSTENHRLMIRTARYLAAQTWPGATFASDASDAEYPTDVTGEQRLLDRMARYTRNGTVEFDSDTYVALYLGPLRTLADLADDIGMRNRANMTFEWILAENAAQWLDGHYASASLRKKRAYGAQDFYNAAELILWLYFGGPTPAEWYADRGSEGYPSVLMAVSDYRLPSVIHAAGTQRSAAYLHREYDEWTTSSYYHSTYVNQTYALYSSYENYPVHRRFSSQYHRWSVDITGISGPASFFFKHPDPVDPDPYGTSTEGTTGYEQVLQHDGTLIGVYDVPAADARPYISGNVPAGYLAHIDNSGTGYIYLHYGSVMIGMYLTEPFNWNDGDASFTKNLTQAGFVVETALPGDYGSGTPQQQLDAFKAALLPRFNAATFAAGATDPRLTYTTGDGTALDITFVDARTFDGERRVNGQLLDLAADWPLLDNPWMQQSRGGDTLTISAGGTTRRYDFANWTVAEGDAQPFARYPLDGSPVDASGNGHDGLPLGDAAYSTTAKQGGTAGYFSGAGAIDVSAAPVATAFDTRTLTLWIDSDNRTGTRTIYEEGGISQGLIVRTVDQTLEVRARAGAENATVVIPYNLSGYAHLAVVFDYGALRLYLDGALVGQDFLGEPGVAYHGNPAAVGAVLDASIYGAGNGGVSEGFVGAIDDVRLFDAVLDATQVAAVMADLAAAPLPVDLVAFGARNDDRDHVLSWRTASERNSAGFALERSRDGRTFVEIAWVPACGDCPAGDAYVERDRDAPVGTTYYRLVQHDRDGDHAYSSVVAAHRGAGTSARAYPSPLGAADALTVELGAPVESNTAVTLLDGAGRVLERFTLPANADRLRLPLAHLPPGPYALRVGDSAQTLRFVR